MNKTGAAIRLLIGTAIRVDKVRALIVLVVSPLLGMMAAADGLAFEWMVDGAVRAEPSLFLMGAATLIVVTVAIYQIGAAAANLRVALQQRVELELDRELMALCATRPHVDHYQDPTFLDTVELLRQRQGEVGNAFAAVVENANMLAWFAASSALLGSASPILALLPLFALPLVFATRRQGRLIGDAERDTAELDRHRKALFTLAADPAAARELRLYQLGDEIAGRHREAFGLANRTRNIARTRAAIGLSAGWAVFALALVGGLIIVVRSVAAGTSSPGEAVLVAVLGIGFTGTAGGIGRLIAWLRRALETAGLYVRLLEYRHDHGPRRRAADLESRGDIVFDGVTFAYPGQTTPVVTNLDLRLPAGATVALVGDNGAGKSTLVALLAGLYAPSSGRITVGGTDLADIDPAVWRSRITACFQDFCRFELLLRQTVGLGDHTALSDTAVIASALDQAGAAGWVAGLPAGLETQLGPTFPDGTNLSTGQWQQVALARARMRPTAALILLDEPAASLDPDTEAALLSRYLSPFDAAKDRPIKIIVSHRLTTVRTADLIVVLDRGRVAELGSHADLIDLNGRYADMYKLQTAAYSETYRGRTEPVGASSWRHPGACPGEGMLA
jgi:ATP-binding cassette, subfamily B, bacterial